MLDRIAAASAALGIGLVKTDKAAAFECDGEIIGFSISEATRREKHVLTEKEVAEEAAYQKKRKQYWSKPASWDDEDFSIFPPRFPE